MIRIDTDVLLAHAHQLRRVEATVDNVLFDVRAASAGAEFGTGVESALWRIVELTAEAAISLRGAADTVLGFRFDPGVSAYETWRRVEHGSVLPSNVAGATGTALALAVIAAMGRGHTPAQAGLDPILFPDDYVTYVRLRAAERAEMATAGPGRLNDPLRLLGIRQQIADLSPVDANGNRLAINVDGRVSALDAAIALHARFGSHASQAVGQTIASAWADDVALVTADVFAVAEADTEVGLALFAALGPAHTARIPTVLWAGESELSVERVASLLARLTNDRRFAFGGDDLLGSAPAVAGLSGGAGETENLLLAPGFSETFLLDAAETSLRLRPSELHASSIVVGPDGERRVVDPRLLALHAVVESDQSVELFERLMATGDIDLMVPTTAGVEFGGVGKSVERQAHWASARSLVQLAVDERAAAEVIRHVAAVGDFVAQSDRRTNIGLAGMIGASLAARGMPPHDGEREDMRRTSVDLLDVGQVGMFALTETIVLAHEVERRLRDGHDVIDLQATADFVESIESAHRTYLARTARNADYQASVDAFVVGMVLTFGPGAVVGRAREVVEMAATVIGVARSLPRHESTATEQYLGDELAVERAETGLQRMAIVLGATAAKRVRGPSGQLVELHARSAADVVLIEPTPSGVASFQLIEFARHPFLADFTIDTGAGVQSLAEWTALTQASFDNPTRQEIANALQVQQSRFGEVAPD